MKSPRFVSRPALAGFLLAGLVSCKKAAPPAAPEGTATPSPSPAAQAISAEPSSFAAVASHLDTGGGMFFYLSTDGMLKAGIEATRTALDEMGGLDNLMAPQEQARFKTVWKSLKPFVADSGVREITGLGVSSFAIGPDLYRTKSFLHHDANAKGFLWKLQGKQARALELIPYLPKSTAVAASVDLNVELLWAELEHLAAAEPSLRAGIDQTLQQVKAATGMELPKILAGLGPNYSYFLTLDESRPLTLPLPGLKGPLSIPEVRLAVMIQIRDAALLKPLEAILAKAPNLVSGDEAGFKVREVNLPNAMPFVTPTIAWKDDLLILSSSQSLFKEILAVKAGKKPGLAADAGFQRLFKGLPSPASRFGYLNPVFNDLVRKIQTFAIEQDPKADASVKGVFQAIYSAQPKEPTVGVGLSLPDGEMNITHSGVGPRQIARLWSAIPVAIFASAKAAKPKVSSDRAQAEEVLQSLRLLDAAIDQWALEKGKKPGDQASTNDLKPYFKPGTALYKACADHPGATAVELLPGLPGAIIPPVDGKLLVPAAIQQKFRETCPDDFWRSYARP